MRSDRERSQGGRSMGDMESSIEVHMDRIFESLYNKALKGNVDCSDLFKLGRGA